MGCSAAAADVADRERHEDRSGCRKKPHVAEASPGRGVCRPAAGAYALGSALRALDVALLRQQSRVRAGHELLGRAGVLRDQWPPRRWRTARSSRAGRAAGAARRPLPRPGRAARTRRRRCGPRSLPGGRRVAAARATDWSTASPAGWPCSSLIRLKSSRSIRISAYGSSLAAARSSARSNPRRLHTPVSGSSSAIARCCDSALTRRPFRNWIASSGAGPGEREHGETRGIADVEDPVVVEERRGERVHEQAGQRPREPGREEV